MTLCRVVGIPHMSGLDQPSGWNLISPLWFVAYERGEHPCPISANSPPSPCLRNNHHAPNLFPTVLWTHSSKSQIGVVNSDGRLDSCVIRGGGNSLKGWQVSKLSINVENKEGLQRSRWTTSKTGHGVCWWTPRLLYTNADGGDWNVSVPTVCVPQWQRMNEWIAKVHNIHPRLFWPFPYFGSQHQVFFL